MPKKLLSDLPEAFVSNSEITALVSREVRHGKLRKIGPKIYTTNLHALAEVIVRRNLWMLVAQLFPDAIIADRTAIESAPANDGSVFLISKKKNKAYLAGITIHPRRGSGALADDREFIGGLTIASPGRALLENMRPSRARKGKVSRTLSRVELEEYLEDLLQRRGEPELNKIRDAARRVARALKLQKEFHTLDQLIGTLLTTRSVAVSSPRALARVKRTPYDASRIELFEELRRVVELSAPVTRLAKPPRADSGTVLPFYEAYFSNFIEGTEFEVSEAEEIVFKGKISPRRLEDSHDILATYKLVSDSAIMSETPRSAKEFLQALKAYHHKLLGKRLDKSPGEFKRFPNRAGGTHFVDPALVEGTLQNGFELSRSISTPFGRAVYLMFLVAEVHPFVDGNGRIARIFMNIELVAAGEQRILIPTVYRNDYLSALKALSHNRRAEVLIRVLDFAQRFTAAVDWSDLAKSRELLQRSNAFLTSEDAESSGARLKLPDM